MTAKPITCLPNITLQVWNWEASPCFYFQMRCNCNKFRLKSLGSTKKRSLVGPSWVPICGVDLIDRFILSFSWWCCWRKKNTAFVLFSSRFTRLLGGKGFFVFNWGVRLRERECSNFILFFIHFLFLQNTKFIFVYPPEKNYFGL